MYPLVYDRVLVNEGSAWQTSKNTVVIPRTGYYLVHYGSGVPAGRQLYLYLYSSDTSLTLLYRFSQVHNGVDTLGKTVLRRFESGNVIKIVTGSNTFSSAMMQTTFMGLLLHEG